MMRNIVMNILLGSIMEAQAQTNDSLDKLGNKAADKVDDGLFHRAIKEQAESIKLQTILLANNERFQEFLFWSRSVQKFLF